MVENRERRRVVVTGMGCITPLGKSVEELWKNLLDVRSGISKTFLFDAETFPTTFSAQVKDFDLAEHIDDPGVHAHAGRNTSFALAAAQQAWDQSKLAESGADPQRIGVYMGSGEGSLDIWNFLEVMLGSWRPEQDELDDIAWGELAMEKMSGVTEFEQEPNMPAAHMAARFGAQGPNFNCLTACAASTQATGEAMWAIRRGDADVMITGGCHSMIHPFGVTGFNRLTALSTRNDSPQTASRPFDRTRDGFVLGEGASVLVLEELEHAKARGATILAELVGFGSTADAYRITDIHPSGQGGAGAMGAAMRDAGITPDDVDLVCAHGTATSENDKTETMACKAALGERAPDVPVVSPKSMLGHLIAAAGATELITCILTIRDGVIPPTANLHHPDPECDLDYVPNEPRKAPVRTVINNSFGFGGQNDSVVVTRYED